MSGIWPENHKQGINFSRFSRTFYHKQGINFSRFSRTFYHKQGQGFKVRAAPRYPNLGWVPPLPRGERSNRKRIEWCLLRKEDWKSIISGSIDHFRNTLQFPRTITRSRGFVPSFLSPAVFSRTKPRLQVIVRRKWSESGILRHIVGISVAIWKNTNLIHSVTVP